MKVEFYERARFKVTCHGAEWTVDLLTHNCNGDCNCWPFVKYIKPAILGAEQSGTFVPGDAYRCPHIMEARKVMLDLFLARLAQQFPDNECPI